MEASRANTRRTARGGQKSEEEEEEGQESAGHGAWQQWGSQGPGPGLGGSVEEEQSYRRSGVQRHLGHPDSSCKSPLIIGRPAAPNPWTRIRRPPIHGQPASVSGAAKAGVRRDQIRRSQWGPAPPITGRPARAAGPASSRRQRQRLSQASLAIRAHRNPWRPCARPMLALLVLLLLAASTVVLVHSADPIEAAGASLAGSTIETKDVNGAPATSQSDSKFLPDQPGAAPLAPLPPVPASDPEQAAPAMRAARQPGPPPPPPPPPSQPDDKKRRLEPVSRSQLDRRHQFPLDRHDNQSANQSNGLFRSPLAAAGLQHEDSRASSSRLGGWRRRPGPATTTTTTTRAQQHGLLLAAATTANKLAGAGSNRAPIAATDPRPASRDEPAGHNELAAPEGMFTEPPPVVGQRQQMSADDLSTEAPLRSSASSWARRQQLASPQAPQPEPEPLDLIMGPPDSIELREDDLFLAEGSPSSAWAELSWRHQLDSRRLPPPAAQLLSKRAAANEQLQTIYFGGFFPWLGQDVGGQPGGAKPTGTSVVDQESPLEERPHQRLAAASHITPATPERHRYRQRNITPMINEPHANQDEPAASPGPQSRPKQLTSSASGAQMRHQFASYAAGHHHQLKPLSTTSTYAAPHPTSTLNQPTSQRNQDSHHQLGQFILPSVRLALDHINTNNSLLRRYKLETVPRDTQCNATLSLKEFFDMVYEAPKKMLLYGDACRVSTDPIAKASYFFDLIQISYADTDPIYTIENYPNFFRVVPSENALSLARIPFIRHFNWTRVGTIYQNLPRYSLPHSKLLTDLERFNIVIKQSVSLPGSVEGLQDRDLGDELRKLKEKDVRIILGNFDEEWALLLFCEAFREMMTGRKYQWILTGMSEQKLWQLYRNKGSSCTEQELLVAMDGYIVTDIATVTRSQAPTISGMMAHEYSNEYRKRAREMNIILQDNKFYGYVYDGVWAIALALNRVDSQLKYYSQLAQAGKVELKPEMQGLSSLLDFNYHKPVWATLIRSALNRTRFEGVTGTVSFQKNERPGLITFSQFQAFRDTSVVVVGSYDGLKEQLDLKMGFPIFWRGPSPPVDYTIERVTPFRINRTLFVILSILAVCGIILACIFLTINIKFRNQRYIKMSSPYLNNLIIIGCILTYTSVIILGLDSGLTSEYNFPYICNARAWVLMAGFTLAFGSMFSKTFRVHSIFTNIKLHKRVIKDYKLFMVVLILLAFDVCILIVWQYFDPFYRETNNGTSIQDSDNEDLIIVPEMEHCQSKRMTIFLTVIYVYKGLLMAFGCFLAWETRHVSIPALNDSKYIGLSVYNVVIMCVIGAALSFVLRDQQDASFVIISIFIIFCSTTTLCLVFVPKLRMLIELKQNPRASDHRVRATLKTFKKNYQDNAFGPTDGYRDARGNLVGGRGSAFNTNERIKELTDQNLKQRFMLKEKTYELEALTYKYRKIQAMIQSQQYELALKSTACDGAAVKDMSMKALDGSLSVPGAGLQAECLVARAKRMAADNSNLSQQYAAKDDSSHPLRLTSLISNSTHLVTSNTTSSNNNHTDVTLDYSSPKVVSCMTTTNDSISKAATCTSSALHKSILKNHCRPTTGSTPGHLKDTPQQPSDTSRQRPANSGPPRGVLRVIEPRQNSSSNSLLKDNSKPGYFNSLENPFSIFSRATTVRHRKRNNKCDLHDNNLVRWSKGPFCTLIVRKELEDQIKQPEQLAKLGRKRHQSCLNNTCWSCPSFPVKQRHLRSRLKPPRLATNLYSSGLHHSYSGRAGSRLHRTLSMIEYLGLSEADLIAKRHDKLNKRKLNREDTSLPCCYKLSSCLYCVEPRTSAQCQMIPPDTPQMMPSSSEPLDLNNMSPQQPLSSVTCSICCSLFSESYGLELSPCRAAVLSSTNSFSSQTHLSYNDFHNIPNNNTYNMHKSRFSSKSSSIADQDFSRLIYQHCRHSDETYSSLADEHHSNRYHSSSTDSSSSTFLGSPNKAQDYGMCSLGAGCCDLATSESAGLVEAHPNHHHHHHKIPPLRHNPPPPPPTTVPQSIGMAATGNSEDDVQQNITIKCDVLESL